MEDTVDAFFCSNDPESCCANGPFCEGAILVFVLFMEMPHKQGCNVAAAWNDKRELFSCVECCVVEPTSYSQKALFVHIGVLFSQRTVF